MTTSEWTKVRGFSTAFRDGRFWVIDALTLREVETFPPFDTIAEARAAIGDRLDDATAESVAYGV